MAQRLLLIIAVMHSWRCISLDISAAFLQGLALEEATAAQGKTRNVWAKPPSDAWEILRELKKEHGLELPVRGYESHWLWRLLKAAYGLDDAPLLWRKALADCLLDRGWFESKHDKCMYYLRENGAPTGRLIGSLTLHIDDEGLAAEEQVIAELVAAMTERFGELKLQENKFHHIGHEYVQTWDDQGQTTITDGQEFYTKTIEPAPTLTTATLIGLA